MNTFTNKLMASKTFAAIIILILIDVLMRMPVVGLDAAAVAQVHELIVASTITFGAKETITNFATKGAASGNVK